jgi:hypothetical protein
MTMVLSPAELEDLMKKVERVQEVIENFWTTFEFGLLYEVQEAEWIIPYLKATKREEEAKKLEEAINLIHEKVGYIAKIGSTYYITDTKAKKRIAEIYGIVDFRWDDN